VDKIKKLNPELLTYSTPPGIYQIKVPKGTGDVDLTLPKAPIKTPAKKLKKSPSPPSNKTS
ncbi:MAG: hypothetical protein ACKOB3_03020, partial [Holophagaceae bacterium]